MAHSEPAPGSNEPYQDQAINRVYELLFCDSIPLYKNNHRGTVIYPWDILFAELINKKYLEQLLTARDVESRIQLLACHQLMHSGNKPDQQELLGVIVEVALDEGLDVLAAYLDGTARYINHTGRLLIWEAHNEQSMELTEQLFRESRKVIAQIGPWDQPRKPPPITGNVRLSFLVTDGLYFGEGPINVLFTDARAADTLAAATEFMKFLTSHSL
jgi:hypothetical protein